MLGKIILHGLMAVVLVAGAAGLYAASAGPSPTFRLEDGEGHP